MYIAIQYPPAAIRWVFSVRNECRGLSYPASTIRWLRNLTPTQAADNCLMRHQICRYIASPNKVLEARIEECNNCMD